MEGWVIQPPPIKACNRKTNKIKPIEIIKRKPRKEKEEGGCARRERELRGRENQGKEAVGDQFVG